MNSQNPSAVIFDVDGTLVHSAPDVIADLGRSIEECGLSVPEGLNQNLIGPPMIEIIQKLVPSVSADIHQEIFQKFRHKHDSSDLNLTRLYDGVFATLELLSLQSVPLFVATNKPRKGVLNLLDKLGLKPFFADIACFGDPQIGSKFDSVNSILTRNNLVRNTCWMIGDAPSDILAGQKNQTKTIAHLGGYSAPEKLLATEPDYVASSMVDVLKFFKT